MDNFCLTAPQGWQCPICGRVYSPMTPMCFYCNTGEVGTFSSTTGNFKINYGNTDIETTEGDKNK